MSPYAEADTYFKSNKEGLDMLLDSTDKVAYFDDLEGKLFQYFLNASLLSS